MVFALPRCKQSRQWALVTYVDESVIERVLDSKSAMIRHYAYILHDEDGVEPHRHVVLQLYSPCAQTTVINWFRAADVDGKPVNTLAEPATAIDSLYNYLTHSDDVSIASGKHLYDAADIVCDDPAQFAPAASSQDSAAMALSDLLDGRLTLRECALKYGRDFIYHYSSYRQLLSDIRYEEESGQKISDCEVSKL